MENFVDFVNKFLSIGTILLQLIIVLIIINLVFIRSRSNKFLLFFKKYTFILGFLIALGAVVCTLFYSEIVGYPPCELCWVQRIFLYPQLVLFGIELYKRERSIVDFSIAFAILGSITSIYHIFVESGLTAGPLCADPSNGGVSCSIRYIYEFGYMTMPLMALTLSLFIITILLNYKYMTRIK